MRVTIKDVAKESGFAPSTVSMALRNHPEIPEATRYNIQETAAALGYRRNAFLSNFASLRRGQGIENPPPIGFIAPSSGPLRPGIEEFCSLFPPLAKDLGYRPECSVSPITTLSHLRRELDILHARGVSGLILSLRFLPCGWESLDWERFAIVSVASADQQNPFNTVKRANFEDMRTSWKKLLELGYRRIGIETWYHDPTNEDDWERFGAIQSLLHEQGIRCDTTMIQGSDPVTDCPILSLPPIPSAIPKTEARAARAVLLKKWVDTYRPDAIISFSPITYWLLSNIGIRCPEDIGFCSLNTYPKAKPHVPEISGMRKHPGRLIRSAIDMLDRMLRHSEFGIQEHPKTLRITSSWLEGSTTAQRVTGYGISTSPMES